ncbi:MAG: hypothetical protein WDW38_003979 [Sanguina aurantia]
MWKSELHSYQIIKRLGHGAFGEVHLARVLETGELVALKGIHVRSSGQGLPDNVIREIMCLRTVEDPHVVRLRDVFPKGNSMVLVLEYCILDLAVLLRKAKHLQAEITSTAVADSFPLSLDQQQRQQQQQQQQLPQQGPSSQPTPDSVQQQPLHRQENSGAVAAAQIQPTGQPPGSSVPHDPRATAAAPASLHVLPEAYIKGIIHQVLMGVAACHSVGILHRDLKPSNILIDRHGVLKVADFGLARPHDGGENPRYTHTVATRWYRAPELLYGARCYGPAVDLWAVGAILAELLGGKPFITGENDIDQLSLMTQTLGSIEARWPGVGSTPDWGKVTFRQAEGRPLTELLPTASGAALSLLGGLIRYDPAARTTASDALLDPWFTTDPPPAPESQLASLLQRALQDSAAVKAVRGASQRNDGVAGWGGGRLGSDGGDGDGGFDDRQATMSSEGSSDSSEGGGRRITTMPGWR